MPPAAFAGCFFGPIIRGVRAPMLPFQWAALNDRVPGGARSAFLPPFAVAAGLKEGSHGGFVFQDTDLAK